MALEWALHPRDHRERRRRIPLLRVLASPRVLPAIERYFEDDPEMAIGEQWGRLAAQSRIPWAVAREWMTRGRPLSLVALGGLVWLAKDGPAEGWVKPTTSELEEATQALARSDDNPRVQHEVAFVLSNSERLAR